MSSAAEKLFPESTTKKLLEWTDELSVGIQEIDEQHKVLVDLLNQLHQAILEHHGQDVTTSIMDRLCEYTKIHFTVEESLLRILNYPDYEEHKQHHEQLLAEVKQLRHKMEHEDHSISFELLHFLKKWLTIHILEDDNAYTEHLLKCGASKTYKQQSWLDKLWHGFGH